MARDDAPRGLFFKPDPDEPGWYSWRPEGSSHFGGLFNPIRVFPREPGRACVRIVPGRKLTNIRGPVHGGAIAGFIDMAIFAGTVGGGVGLPHGAVTAELSIQYFASAREGHPLDAEVEVSRETRRLVFVRGTIEQDGGSVGSFSAILRKISAPRP